MARGKMAAAANVARPPAQVDNLNTVEPGLRPSGMSG